MFCARLSDPCAQGTNLSEFTAKVTVLFPLVLAGGAQYGITQFNCHIVVCIAAV